jgi:hypothetical protein
MAYNWGMGNVDQWIANGSKIEELPKETREYTGKVHGYIRMQETIMKHKEDWLIACLINSHQAEEIRKSAIAQISTPLMSTAIRRLSMRSLVA